MATDWMRFKEQLDDEASEAFRIASEDDRPVRSLCPLPGVHDTYRRADMFSRRAAHKAAQQLGIAVPERRWFKELRSAFDDDPRPVVCGGMVLRGYNIIWLNLQLAFGDQRDLEHTVWHEMAHLGGYDSEEACDRFATRFVGGGGRTATRDSGEIRWLPTAAPGVGNTWDLRTGR
jgi:hypothetical protein